jgi:hypothetical protein
VRVATPPARVALLAALATAGCIAHLPRSDEPTELLERSYVGASTAKNSSLEARPAFHLLLGNGLDQPALFEEGGFAATALFSFLFTLRIARDPSAPVRTPTYEPRLMLQLFDVRPLGARDATAERPRPVRIAALELALGHRSNGQSGCSLANHVRRPGDTDFTCAPLTDPPDPRLNVEDGSFTTDYLGAGGFVRLLVPGPGPGLVDGALTAGAALEWELPCPYGTCMEAGLRARYGDVLARLRAEGEVLAFRGRMGELPLLGPVRLDSSLRLTVTSTLHLATAAHGTFGNVAIQVALLPRNERGWIVGLFAQRNIGYDYLNIRFEERLDSWVFGAVIDPTPLEELGRGRAPARAGE